MKEIEIQMLGSELTLERRREDRKLGGRQSGLLQQENGATVREKKDEGHLELITK